jgi:hypothetical protein
MTGVCQGTNKLNSLDDDHARQHRTGAFHAQEPVSWAAFPLLR